MPTNAAGQAAYQAIISLANTINPNMNASQKSQVAIFAGQIVDQLVTSANATQIGQVANFTGSTNSNDQGDTGAA